MTDSAPEDLRTSPAPDGRSARWVAHRTQRRGEIVDAAIRAIRLHGAAVGMDDIAAMAGTSKTVLYRHMQDKEGLYRAVVERTNERVLSNVVEAVSHSAEGEHDPIATIASTVDAYLALIESDAELYRFIVHRPNIVLPDGENPVSRTVGAVTSLIERSLTRSFGTTADPDRIRVTAIALVGSVDAVADDWLSRPDRPPRDQVVATLTELAAHGLGPMLGRGTGTRRDSTAAR